MKILDSYQGIAKELIKESAWDRKFGEPLPTLQDVMNEVDDDKIIKYRDEEGESQEMSASSAKKLPKDHHAKIAYDTMVKHDDYQAKKDDSEKDDGGEKDSGGNLGGGDFERPDSDDEPDMDSDGTDDKEDDNEEDMDETITINGKKYIPIKESKEPIKPKVHPFKEKYKKIGGE